VLHVQSILEPRSSQGIRDSIRFLDKIACEKIRHSVLFITTKWDLLVKGKGDFENLEMQMAKEEWRSFDINSRDGSRSFRSGVNVDRDNHEDKEMAKEKIISSVFKRYRMKEPEELVMPFSEWSGGEQFVTISKYTIGGIVLAGMGGMLAFGAIVGGLTVEFSINFLF
jgi:hypothetical protein